VTALATLWRILGIRGAIAVGLGLALAFTMWRADSLADARDEAKAALVGEQVRHAVTRASLALLEQRHAAIVADGRARDERVLQARETVARDVAGIRRDIDRINGAVAGDPCVTPQEVIDAGL